ncbi:bifunctional phosphopantothenoylcysteine decarboxylase/phosphopantothenate--cysteine ligase CoaBC [Plantibacter sp. CFBP 8804]|uniref:bifunctional phosphopantothenoylcysteine decarboxylase/phosphopantothenate--cysteine ligase CoaBC n=1 Tax=Plantibacter sp. CFBP 8804 TaxID=2775270 RepID=UPI00177EC225|nr:bifunctional phosphopantothenoylcysteine decarboxylase/phosphopantothenate--cysteine ligase CoaBC [Plantibacter sp. CFBP 8804]MBD8517033.1 bifunctional phosphopantothenoylcysteine decarboxylase/phosphopantothenate--cysteine ligase CoaBC [Plantibacter sp. CFBP 8804]
MGVQDASREAAGRTVVVGITGGIAAYKAVGVVRGFVLAGFDVHVVPTESALRFVGLPTLEAISRNPVTTSLYDGVAEVRHVALGQRAELIVVAPTTANTLAKLAAGLSDDLLGTTILASRAPVLLAPAMHTEMWQHPATTANVALLRSRGVAVIGPAHGALTGGDTGPGRMSEPDDIVAAGLALLTGRTGGTDAHPDDFRAERVVVSAGGTREPLDPVRFLGNRSSGRQGLAIAQAAAERGAEVVLVAAHLDADVAAEAAAVDGLRIVPVGTAAELAVAMEDVAADATLVVMAAAVADYRAAEIAERKIKKDDTGEELTLRLVRNPDVLAGLAAAPVPGRMVVGFAAETAADREELLALGRAKAARKGADLLVLNRVGWMNGFGTADNEVVVIDGAGEVVGEATGSKRSIADRVLDLVLAHRAEPVRSQAGEPPPERG